MRLLKRDDQGALNLTDDLLDQDIPEYVVLSHTWGASGQEVTLQDFQSLSGERQTGRAGYAKIRFCSDQAASDGHQYIWIDTCCIDKTNSVELTEAINSMFRWYREAARCYVYLSDVKVGESQNNDWRNDFMKSRWFTRGWTLQELLAPKSVEFFSSDGVRLGDKTSLEGEIHRITGIAVDALRGRSLSDFSVSERMAWATKRTTTRKEDEAYSLLGIFDVNMPLIYGERERALARLMEEIDRSLQDPSMPALHPVKKNYRKVHVTVLHWEADGLQDVSDVLVVLDCFVEGLAGPDVQENISFLLDDDDSWARYLLLFAGYTNPSTAPGRMSQKLMSLLEELAISKRFYAREGLITSQILREKLEREVRFDDDLNLHWFGNDGKDFIHLSPLQRNA
ncbi:MAG: hypothetical protein LQ350_001088 [Teloschistes chrysophthalmus]|nr:MAG: hypothetical protein LQ350_001088 [Niorma chrysophthalma]